MEGQEVRRRESRVFPGSGSERHPPRPATPRGAPESRPSQPWGRSLPAGTRDEPPPQTTRPNRRPAKFKRLPRKVQGAAQPDTEAATPAQEAPRAPGRRLHEPAVPGAPGSAHLALGGAGSARPGTRSPRSAPSPAAPRATPPIEPAQPPAPASPRPRRPPPRPQPSRRRGVRGFPSEAPRGRMVPRGVSAPGEARETCSHSRGHTRASGRRFTHPPHGAGDRPGRDRRRGSEAARTREARPL
ncbi:PREDICTED: proline-rich protein HaeIII subfamily 1-like [Elephantulus edwardii]|uniref:proline-rich protein HaeIII subfamily 1-like n=1 Tax=Elephantulus edwardii TaxID=28737 RepID=UPI0003F07C28|nr:PREDICTED: proline-rich protein HaeIII subfamily 1-like [Elephantulus edwardii]